VICLVVVLETLGVMVFLYTCAVAMLSPPSANRTLPVRLGITAFCLATFALFSLVVYWIGDRATWIDNRVPLYVWIMSTSIFLSLYLLIAINERDHWGPRVARTIPRRWWLRPVPFLLYSGAAGGVLWTCVLLAVCWLALLVLANWLPALPPQYPSQPSLAKVFTTMTMMFGYTYCYALMAVFLRNTVIKIPPIYTWVMALALAALGTALPYLVAFLIHYRDWSLETHYGWLLTVPPVGMTLVADERLPGGNAAMIFVGCWAVLVTLLDGLWFLRQMQRFRPYRSSTASTGEMLPALLAAIPLKGTKTFP
jgi:hypothetical protein